MPSLALADILRTVLSGRESLLLPVISNPAQDVEVANIADILYLSRYRPERQADQGDVIGTYIYPSGFHPVAPTSGGEWLCWWSCFASSFTLDVRARVEVEINNFYDESNNPITSLQSRTRGQTIFPLAIPPAGDIEEWKQHSACYPVRVVEGKSLALRSKVQNYTSDGNGTAREKDFMALMLNMSGLDAQYYWNSTAEAGPSDPNLVDIPADGQWHDADTIVYTPTETWTGTRRLILVYSFEGYTNPGGSGNQVQFRVLGPSNEELRYTQYYDDPTSHSPLWSRSEFITRAYSYSSSFTFKTQFLAVTNPANYRRRALFVCNGDKMITW